MPELSSAVSQSDRPLVSRRPFHMTLPPRTTGALRFCVRAALVVTAIALLPGDARAQERRACRATGYFLFSLDEHAGGSVTTRTARINILPSDMEVVATAAGQTSSTVTDAKRWACEAAAQCYVQLAKGADCGGTQLGAIFETMKRPDHMEVWRRQVACNHARAGSFPGLRQTSTNKVTLVQTKVVATGSRDGITRHADATISESDHVCWSPSGAADDNRPTDPTPERPGPRPSRPTPDPPPTRNDPDRQPSRTDSSHLPSRTDDSHRPRRANGPSPVESIRLDDHAGRAEGEMSGQRPDAGAARTQPTSRGAVVGHRRRRLSVAEVRSNVHQARSVAGLASSHQSAANGPRDDHDIATGKPAAPIHQGYFQLHFETVSDQERGIPLGESERASFTVDCNAKPPDRLKR